MKYKAGDVWVFNGSQVIPSRMGRIYTKIRIKTPSIKKATRIQVMDVNSEMSTMIEVQDLHDYYNLSLTEILKKL